MATAVDEYIRARGAELQTLHPEYADSIAEALAQWGGPSQASPLIAYAAINNQSLAFAADSFFHSPDMDGDAPWG